MQHPQLHWPYIFRMPVNQPFLQLDQGVDQQSNALFSDISAAHAEPAVSRGSVGGVSDSGMSRGIR